MIIETAWVPRSVCCVMYCLCDAGRLVQGAPECMSYLFNADGKCSSFTGGYIMDRRVGNTCNLGAMLGILKAIGARIPVPGSLTWSFFMLVQKTFAGVKGVHCFWATGSIPSQQLCTFLPLSSSLNSFHLIPWYLSVVGHGNWAKRMLTALNYLWCPECASNLEKLWVLICTFETMISGDYGISGWLIANDFVQELKSLINKILVKSISLMICSCGCVLDFIYLMNVVPLQMHSSVELHEVDFIPIGRKLSLGVQTHMGDWSVSLACALQVLCRAFLERRRTEVCQTSPCTTAVSDKILVTTL